jgi:hypothetical protein
MINAHFELGYMQMYVVQCRDLEEDSVAGTAM